MSLGTRVVVSRAAAVEVGLDPGDEERPGYLLAETLMSLMTCPESPTVAVWRSGDDFTEVQVLKKAILDLQECEF